jgi:hypothetical protein
MYRIIIGLMLMFWVGAQGATADDVPAIDMSNFGGGGLAPSISKPMLVGWEFEVLAQVTATRVGVWDSTGQGMSHDVSIAIWTATGTEIVRGVVPSGKQTAIAGGCRHVAIQPTLLNPGRYVIGALYPIGSDVTTYSGYNSFASIKAIRWMDSLRSESETLELPRLPNRPRHPIPGDFGPNFFVDLDPNSAAQPGTYYYLATVHREPQMVVRTKPMQSDGSHREVPETTISLFATPDGKLTQILLDGEPLGIGDAGFMKLAVRMREVNPPQELRPTIRIAFSDAVTASDLKSVMVTANRAHDDGRARWEPGRGCDVTTIYDARLQQLSKNGTFVAPDRFRDAGEYVEDRWTGLLWQKDGDDSGEMDFYDAAEYAKRLKLGGVTGWRVPILRELATIFPATFAPFSDTHYSSKPCCSDKEDSPSYWTSEKQGGPDSTIAILYHWYEKGGGNNCIAGANGAYVRCVRGPLQPHEMAGAGARK